MDESGVEKLFEQYRVPEDARSTLERFDTAPLFWQLLPTDVQFNSGSIQILDMSNRTLFLGGADSYNRAPTLNNYSHRERPESRPIVHEIEGGNPFTIPADGTIVVARDVNFDARGWGRTVYPGDSVDRQLSSEYGHESLIEATGTVVLGYGLNLSETAGLMKRDRIYHEISDDFGKPASFHRYRGFQAVHTRNAFGSFVGCVGAQILGQAPIVLTLGALFVYSTACAIFADNKRDDFKNVPDSVRLRKNQVIKSIARDFASPMMLYLPEDTYTRPLSEEEILGGEANGSLAQESSGLGNIPPPVEGAMGTIAQATLHALASGGATEQER